MKNNKMKNIFKILFIIFIILSLFILFSNSIIVNAVPNMSGIYTTPSGANLVNDRASQILGYISVIGFGAGVIMIAIIGLRYIYASPDGKADLKKQMMPYFIGALLLVSGGALAKIVIEAAMTFN